MLTITKLLAGLVAIYAIVVAVAYAAQRRLMYFPNPVRVAPSTLGLLGVAERIIETPDGERLVSWWSPPAPGQPTLLYLHGNGGSLANRAIRLSRYQQAGIGVVMLSWRSYSGSTGRPSEAANVADARLAYDRVRASGVAPHDIVLYGESLGSGVAVRLATEVPVGGVVLDAPYTSVVELAERGYPMLPVRWLLKDRYETWRYIRRIKAPLLVLHGSLDAVIPVAMGRALYDAAPEPKELAIFALGNHVDLDAHGAVEAVLGWLLRRSRPHATPPASSAR